MASLLVGIMAAHLGAAAVLFFFKPIQISVVPLVRAVVSLIMRSTLIVLHSGAALIIAALVAALLGWVLYLRVSISSFGWVYSR